MNTEKFNIYSSFIFMELSYISKKFRDLISKKFKDLSEVYINLLTSTSDDSRKHIVSLYASNESVLKPVLHQYLLDNESEFNWTDFLNKYDITPVAGKIFRIKKSDEDYMNFTNRMQSERWIFSYMSVAVDKDEYVIFFA